MPWIIAACALFVMVIFFHKAFLWLLKLCVKGVAGGVGFLAANSILGAAGLSLAVGINAVTVLVAALLGAPGFLLLYALQLVLR
jgi:hypothetical protein